MSQFKENLNSLPSVVHLASLSVGGDNVSEAEVVIENKPGKSGSLAVYHYLKNEFGMMTPAAAQRGLALFGEYTEEAKINPGSHPNIDFLFKVIEDAAEYQMTVVEK